MFIDQKYTTVLVGGNPWARWIRTLRRRDDDGRPAADSCSCSCRREMRSWPSSGAPAIGRHGSAFYFYFFFLNLWSKQTKEKRKRWRMSLSLALNGNNGIYKLVHQNTWASFSFFFSSGCRPALSSARCFCGIKSPVRERGTPSVSAISPRRTGRENGKTFRQCRIKYAASAVVDM